MPVGIRKKSMQSYSTVSEDRVNYKETKNLQLLFFNYDNKIRWRVNAYAKIEFAKIRQL